jgi:chromosome segregation ATPase
MFNPLKRRAKKASEDAADVLADYSTRLFSRLGQIAKTLESIESRSQDMQTRLDAISLSAQKSATTQTEMIAAAERTAANLSELFAIMQDQGEEISTLHAQLAEVQRENAQITDVARAGKYDVANVQMLARTAKLFSQVDPQTVLIALNEFDLAALEQGLQDVDEKRWLELQIAFEAARRNREG